MRTLALVGLLDCGITGGEVRETEHMHGGAGQDERQPGKARGCSSQTLAVGGYQDSAVVR